VAWAPSKLLGGKIDIANIAVGRLAVARQPLPPDEKPLDEAGAASSIPKLELGRLSADEVALAEPVLGAAARLTLTASLRLQDFAAGFFAAVEAERIDGVAGRLRAEARYRPDSKSFGIEIDAEEPAGGLLSRLGKLEGLPAIKAQLRGNGTLDAWTGTAEVWSGEERVLHGTANIRPRGSDHALTLDVQASSSRLVPKNYASALADGITAHVELVFGPAKGIEIDRAEVAAAGLRLKIRGRIEPEFQKVAITYEMNSADARVGSLVAADTGWSRLTVSGAIEGAPDSPVVMAELDIRDLAFRGNKASSLLLKLRAEPQKSGRDGRFAITGAGSIEGAVPRDRRLEPILKPKIEWSVAATVDQSGLADISSLALSLGATQIHFAGRVSAQTVVGRLKLDRFDLASVAALATPGLAGEVSFAADIDATTDLDRLTLRIDGGATSLKLGLPALDGLLGGKLDLAGGVKRAADG
ncbi:MAG: hypothetical protein ACREIP_13235, partial [Alphaproteobacteria bacterium]